MAGIGKHEDAAIAIMRKAVCDAADTPIADFRVPGNLGRSHSHKSVDAGSCGMLADVVRDAHEAGRREVALYVRAAWAEFIDSDDIDAFVEALSELPSDPAETSKEPVLTHSATGICTLAPDRPHADVGICRACVEQGLFDGI
jgi:hypothetical protein